MTTTTHLPPYWAEHLIAVVGGHQDAEKLRFLHAWAQAEGGTAKWNPLNSTLSVPGVTEYNSAGVKNYPRAVWGVCATAMTLTGPTSGTLFYPKLLGHLQSAAGTYTAVQILNDCETEIAVWGTDVATIASILAAT